MGIAEYLKEKSILLDESLKRALPDGDGVLEQAMRYAVFPGGKRFRPVLSMACAEALQKDPALVLPLACALELVHSFSLIHDDLPAMDDDDYRRGKASTHRIFGEAQALLAGDALVILAFQVLSSAASTGVSPRAILATLQDLAESSGLAGMVGGQSLDILYQDTEIEEETLRLIDRKKTGALIRCAVRGAALLCEAQDPILSRLTRFGEKMGLLFQAVDDILDAEADEKVSFVHLLGVEGTRKVAEAMAREALEELEGLGPSFDRLRDLVDLILKRGNRTGG